MIAARHLALLSVSFFAIASPSFAQETAAPDTTPSAYGTDDIIVTARRRDESVQDVPAVVNAVTADTLEKLNLREFEDIQAVVPGLSLVANANGVGSVNTIRGVNFDVNVSGNAATVEFYYNDAPISSNAVLQGLFDVGQIEVLRGPQGTLRGRASPSGAINITTRKPNLYEVGGNVNATVNDINGYNFNGALNVPVIEGKLGVRVAGIISDDDGSRVRPFNDPDAKLRNSTEGARYSVSADPLNGMLLLDFSYQTLTHNSLQYSQVQSIQDYDPESPLASPNFIRAKDRMAVAGRYPLDVRQKFKMYHWQAQLNLWDQRLTYVGLRTTQYLDGINPQDNAGIFLNQTAPLSYFGGVSPTGGIIGIPTGRSAPYAWHSITRSKNTSHEVRLQNDTRIAGMFDYVAGFMQYDTGSDTDFDRSVGVIATPFPPQAPTEIAQIYSVPLVRYIDELERSVFGNLTAHIGEATEISGGLRHIWYETTSGLTTFGIEDPGLRREFDTTATIWTASAKHRVNDNLMVYASAGSSWRPNTVVIGGPVNASPFQLQFQGTPAEKSKSYEVGFKSSWLDNRLRVNVTGFYQKFKNYPYRALVGPWSIVPASYNPNDLSQLRVEQVQYVAAVPVTVKGMEAEVTFAPLPNLNLGANVSYALGKIENGLVPCTDINQDGLPDLDAGQPNAQDLFAATGTDFVSACNVNQRSANSAPWSGSFTAEYTHPISDSLDGYLRGLYTWKGGSQGEPMSPIDSVEGYGILNLYGGVRHPDGNWEVSLYAKNLTNTFRVLSNEGLRSTATLSHGTLSYTNYYGISVTEPREFGINVKVAFGSR